MLYHILKYQLFLLTLAYCAIKRFRSRFQFHVSSHGENMPGGTPVLSWYITHAS